VFISYSWDDEDHKQWVAGFAERLRDDGIDAIVDETHLTLGGRTPEFMEPAVRDSRFVLVICTDNYKRKFDDRAGGVGYEGHIITSEIISKAGVAKFIPVLRRDAWGTALPTALGGVFGVDLSADATAQYRKLVAHLHGAIAVRPVGPKPSWLRMGQGTPGARTASASVNSKLARAYLADRPSQDALYLATKINPAR
jgi:hypothetical protein